MKTTDRAVMIGFLAVGLLVGFYLMVLSPKREEAKTLGDEVAQLEASIAEQEQLATYAQQARDEFPKYYGRMVVLGKAVPEEADSASLLVQLNSMSEAAGTSFQTLALAQAQGGASATATPPPTEAAPAEGTTPPSGEAAPAPAVGSEATTAAGTTAVPATEASAASLPIGATVGSAGLPTLPYDLGFTGNFFQIADFLGELDESIKLREESGQVTVDGRLATVDGFALEGGAPGSSPTLEASFLMTTYLTPADQGLTLGATPEGPATVTGDPQLAQTASVTP